MNLGGPAYDDMTSVVVRSGIAGFNGNTYSYGGGNGDMYFFRIQFVWASNSFGTIEHDEGTSLDLANDGGFILGGSSSGFTTSHVPNVYLVKTDTAAQSTGVLDVREVPATQRIGVSVFPNPAAYQCHVYIDSRDPLSGRSDFVLFDGTGRKINITGSWDVEYENAFSGKYTLQLSGIDPGIYFLQVFSGGELAASTRIIITR
jgi:hypothetical protein